MTDFELAIIEEIKATLSEGIYFHNLTEIETYWLVGSMIIGYDLNPRLIDIPEHVKKTAINLYKKYPVKDMEDLANILPHGKLVSLAKLKKEWT